MTTRVDLVIEGAGTTLTLRQERLAVERDGQLLAQYSLRQVGSVRVADQGVSLTTQALAALVQHGVSVHIWDFAQRPLVQLDSPMLSSRARVRAAQLTAATQAPLELARMFVAEKLRAQRRLLVLTRRRSSSLQEMDRAIEQLSTLEGQVLACAKRPDEAGLAHLMGLEGAGAAAYWPALASTSPWIKQFRRVKRGATDPVNASLNYGYAILYSRLWGLCERAGLDPFVGFLHGMEAGRINLVLDVIEPWRVIVDDAVFSWMRRRRSELVGGLDLELRQQIAHEVTQRLLARAQHEGRAAAVQSCMQRNLRQLAEAFEQGTLPSWQVWRWDVRGPRAPQEQDPRSLLDEVFVGRERTP